MIIRYDFNVVYSHIKSRFVQKFKVIIFNANRDRSLGPWR